MAAQLIGIKDLAARALHLLAGAAFTHDENVDSQIANVSHELKDLPHFCALTDDIFESIATVDLLAQPFNFALQAALL